MPRRALHRQFTTGTTVQNLTPTALRQAQGNRTFRAILELRVCVTGRSRCGELPARRRSTLGTVQRFAERTPSFAGMCKGRVPSTRSPPACLAVETAATNRSKPAGACPERSRRAGSAPHIKPVGAGRVRGKGFTARTHQRRAAWVLGANGLPTSLVPLCEIEKGCRSRLRAAPRRDGRVGFGWYRPGFVLCGYCTEPVLCLVLLS